MISLPCNHCHTVLTIDDAFAGGVCRCQHCGTIQTVPSTLRGGNTEPTAAAAAAGRDERSKSLYKSKAARNGGAVGVGDSGFGSGTGLDELAEIVASSGLAGSGLSGAKKSRRAAAPAGPAPAGGAAAPAAAKSGAAPLIAAATVIILVLIGVIVWLVTRGGQPMAATGPASGAATATQTAPPSAGNPGPARAATPNYAGLPLAGPTVIYIVDRGQASNNVFADMIEASFRSAESLGPGRKFQVICWDNGSGVENAMFPTAGAVPATPDTIATGRRAFGDVIAIGRTDPQPALRRAVAQGAVEVVLATGNGWNCDDAFAESVMNVVRGTGAKIHAVSVGGTPAAPGLRSVAQRTGGRFKEMTDPEFQAFTR